jgi:predicted RecB family nuclease
VLEGRADRIAEKRAESGTALALVDFKKKNTPKRSEFYLDKDSKLKNLQLAAYTEILASQGAIVETAFYWSIEKSKPVYVFSLAPQPKTKNPDEFLQERKAVRTMLEDAAQSVRAGQFMEIRPSRDACNGCQWRALCRAHYALEAL